MQRSPGTTSLVVAATLVLAVAMGIGRFAYTPLLPEMMAQLGWSLAQAGDIASANYVGYLAGALLCAWLARWGRDHLWLALGFAGSAGTTLAGMFVASFSGWFVLRFASGVASALCLVFGTGLLMHALLSVGQLRLASRQFAGVGLGIVLTVVLLELPGAADVGAQWGILGVASTVLLLAAWWVLRRSPGPPLTPAAPVPGPARHVPAGMIRLVVAYGLFGIGYVVTATFIVALARAGGGAPWLESAIWLTVGVFVVPSVLFWQRVADGVGLQRALVFAYFVEAVAVCCSVAGDGPRYLLPAAALLGGTFAGITALGLNAARALTAHRGNESIAWMTVSFSLGQLVGPAAAGRLAEQSGSFLLPSVLAAALLVVGLVLVAGIDSPAHATEMRPPDSR